MPSLPTDTETIAASMKKAPQEWAAIYLEQQKTIEALEEIVEEYKARLEMLLRDPDEHDH